MTTYTVTFDRIGRNHSVQPLTVEVDGPAHLADLVYAHARPHLGSREVEVAVDLQAMAGQIFVGDFRNGGTFAIAEAGPDRGAA